MARSRLLTSVSAGLDYAVDRAGARDAAGSGRAEYVSQTIRHARGELFGWRAPKGLSRRLRPRMRLPRYQARAQDEEIATYWS